MAQRNRNEKKLRLSQVHRLEKHQKRRRLQSKCDSSSIGGRETKKGGGVKNKAGEVLLRHETRRIGGE